MILPILIILTTSILISIGFWLFKRSKKKFVTDLQSQIELDAYLEKSLSKSEIGRFYERYIGYLHESEGHDVTYHGAVKGYADRGVDLIVRGKKEIIVVQTKCWSKERIIDEDYVFRFWVSTTHFKKALSIEDQKIAKSIFFTTTVYSDLAKEAAQLLGIEINTKALDKTYPMIKCNVNINGEKIFHLPFDKYYDKIKIKPQEGEFFAKTVDEAVQKGFRRSKI